MSFEQVREIEEYFCILSPIIILSGEKWKSYLLRVDQTSLYAKF